MTHIADGMGKGIGLGAVAASLLVLAGLATTDTGPIAWQSLPSLLSLALLTFAFALLFMTAAAVIVGLPVVWLFRCAGLATSGPIGLAGALTGATLFMLPVLTGGGEFELDLILFAIPAILGGGITGAAWGAVLSRRSEEECNTHPNRIDDPRILR